MNLKRQTTAAAILLLSLTFAVRAEYRVLHHFAGGANDGAMSECSLICSDSTLYGMTSYGGSSDLGTIFKINTDGNSFQVLHSFTSPAVDGTFPTGSLILSGSTLFGMACSLNTSYGGT